MITPRTTTLSLAVLLSCTPFLGRADPGEGRVLATGRAGASTVQLTKKEPATPRGPHARADVLRSRDELAGGACRNAVGRHDRGRRQPRVGITGHGGLAYLGGNVGGAVLVQGAHGIEARLVTVGGRHRGSGLVAGSARRGSSCRGTGGDLLVRVRAGGRVDLVPRR